MSTRLEPLDLTVLRQKLSRANLIDPHRLKSTLGFLGTVFTTNSSFLIDFQPPIIPTSASLRDTNRRQSQIDFVAHVTAQSSQPSQLVRTVNHPSAFRCTRRGCDGGSVQFLEISNMCVPRERVFSRCRAICPICVGQDNRDVRHPLSLKSPRCP